jgi:nucleoside-diphosphate-sugar epimerase
LNWPEKNVLVTGGASFIGSHLTDGLLDRGATVRVVDDLSSGRRQHLASAQETGRLEFREADLLEPGVAREAVRDIDVVFHLAANHGGRGYIDTHEAACATNLALDGLMIREAHRAGIEHFTFASSGCVYPTDLQEDPSQTVYLTEDLVKPPFNADNLYGWAKLMAEETLRAYHHDYGFACASLRYFTAYGERCLENHAVIAMIARAFIHQDPFIVWGTGEQIRNWTYVSDIVDGTIRAAERVRNGAGINLGTMERIRVMDAARMILDRTGRTARLLPDPTKPTGPYNRVSDNRLGRELLGWEPRVAFSEGLDRTIAWYFDSHDESLVADRFEAKLLER